MIIVAHSESVCADQTIGIVAGQTVTLGGRGPGNARYGAVGGYCLELHAHSPSLDHPYPAGVGQVRLRYADGTTATKSLRAALREDIDINGPTPELTRAFDAAAMVSLVSGDSGSNLRQPSEESLSQLKLLAELSDADSNVTASTGELVKWAKSMAKLRRDLPYPFYLVVSAKTHNPGHTKSVVQVQFISDAVVADEERYLDGYDVDDPALIKSFFPSITGRSVDDTQQLIWAYSRRPFRTAEEDGILTYTAPRHDPARPFTVHQSSLQSQGDLALIHSPNGEYFLHDVGANEEEAQAILSRIPPGSDGKKRIRVVITHPDFDHYKGLAYMLNQRDVRIEAIVIGADPTVVGQLTADGPNPFSEKFRKLIVEEIKPRYNPVPDEADVTVYVLKDSTGSVPVTRWREEKDFIAFTIAAESSFEYRVLRLKKPPKGRHSHNLITYVAKATPRIDWLSDESRFGAPELSVLNLGDADLAHLTALEEIELPPVNVLKWPHHAWYPSGKDRAAAEKVMRAILKRFKPQEVLLSVARGAGAEKSSKKVKQRIEWIKQLVESVEQEARRQGIEISIKVNPTDKSSVEYRASLPPPSVLASRAEAPQGTQRLPWQFPPPVD